jgi:hypothetical protein
MKKLIVVVLFALAPAVVPDPGEALTLSQGVARIEAKLNCLRRVPVAQYNDVAAHGDPATGLNASTTYDTLSPTASPANDNPDGLTDLGSYTALDWAFSNLAPDYWVLAIKADANNVPASGCLAKFGAAGETELVAAGGRHDAPSPARADGVERSSSRCKRSLKARRRGREESNFTGWSVPQSSAAPTSKGRCCSSPPSSSLSSRSPWSSGWR